MNNKIQKTIQDWRIAEGTEVEIASDKKKFALEVSLIGDQLYIDVSDAKTDGDYLGVIVEINEGKPCIHLSTEMGGDNILHAFSIAGGLIVTPESGVEAKPAAVSRYTYNENNSTEFR